MASQCLTASSEKKAAGAVLAIHDETRAEDKENEVLLRHHEAQKRGKSERVPLAAIDTSPDSGAPPAPAKRPRIALADGASQSRSAAATIGTGGRSDSVVLSDNLSENVPTPDTVDESEELLLLEREKEIDTIEEVLKEMREEELRDCGMPPGFIGRKRAMHSDPLSAFAGAEGIEIFCNLVKEEVKNIKTDIFAMQDEVTAEARFILVNWMWSIMRTFQQEVFFTAVHLVDSYLLHTRATKSTLQLVGVTAVFISTKYHMVSDRPPLHALFNLCGGACTEDEIVKMELEMLFRVNFRIISVAPCDFLEQWLSMTNSSYKQRLYARFLCKASVLQPSMLRHRPSSIAAAAILVAHTLFPNKEQRPLLPMLYHETEFQQILFVAVELSEFVRRKVNRFLLEEKYHSRDERQAVKTPPPTKEDLEKAVLSLH